MTGGQRAQLAVLGAVALGASPFLLDVHAPGVLPDWVVPVWLGVLALGLVVVLAVGTMAGAGVR